MYETMYVGGLGVASNLDINENFSFLADVKMSARNVASTRSQQNITKMLLLISSVFIALNFPRYATCNRPN
jgi:hypothetical protein